MNISRLFSVEEANALIPRLREMLSLVRTERERMLAMRPDLEKAQSRHIYDWGTPKGADYIRILESFQTAVKNIEDLGVVVKDFDIGLCDFPHKKEGRLVLLC